MTQDDGGYDLKHTPPSEIAPVAPAPRPGEPGWVAPVPVIERADDAAEYDAQDPDIEKNKGMAILAYVCFIIPLVIAPNSKFARFHANQGLLVFILWIVAIFASVFLYFVTSHIGPFLEKIPILNFFLSCVLTLGQIALFLGAIVLTIYGIIQAANGEKHPLPVLGQLTLIK
jgi:uncharacterized membrane protein